MIKKSIKLLIGPQVPLRAAQDWHRSCPGVLLGPLTQAGLQPCQTQPYYWAKTLVPDMWVRDLSVGLRPTLSPSRAQKATGFLGASLSLPVGG